MSLYVELVSLVLERGNVKITAPVTYSSIRRGVNLVIHNLNVEAEFMDMEKFQGVIAIKELPEEESKQAGGVIERTFELTYYPDGREVPDCFKPKFQFKLVGESNEDAPTSLGASEKPQAD